MKDFGWGLSIDIEGFSNQFEHSENARTNAIAALCELMKAILRIGRNVYPGKISDNYSERLFAYQFGDGFVISSCLNEMDANRAVAISISLMRHMMMKGYAVKVAISTGHMSGINSCYPEDVSESESDMVSLGNGLLTTIPVTGTALIRSHKLLSKRSGCVLIIDTNRFDGLPDEIIRNEEDGISIINWVSTESSLSKYISETAGLKHGSKVELIQNYEHYLKKKPVPPESWIISTRASWSERHA